MRAKKSNVRLMAIGSARAGFYGTITHAVRSNGGLLLQAVKEVSEAFKVPFEVKGAGYSQHYEIGPIDEKEIACKVVVEINNYFQYLVSGQHRKQETAYASWKQKCENKRSGII